MRHPALLLPNFVHLAQSWRKRSSPAYLYIAAYASKDLGKSGVRLVLTRTEVVARPSRGIKAK